MDAYRNTKELGRLGERLVADYLAGRGLEVEDRNYRCAAGEADIVAIDRSAEPPEVVLVEVKLRRSMRGCEICPEIAVDGRKRERYRRIARCYLAEHPSVAAVRFDVVAVQLAGDRAYVRHLFDAFGCDGEPL